MRTESFKGTIESAYGKALQTPIKFEGEYEAYTAFSELVSAGDVLSEGEQVSTRNAQRKANARQQAMNAALQAAGIEKPTLETDRSLQFRNIVKSLVASGLSQDVAEQRAESVLGYRE